MWTRTVHTKVSPVYISYSSEVVNGWLGGCCSPVLAVKKKFLLPKRKEQISCKEWAAEVNFAALLPSCSLPSAQSCLLPPHFPLCFSHLELQPSPWGPPQSWKPHGVWLREGSFTIRLVTKEGVHSLPVKATAGSTECVLWAGVHTGPQHRSLSPAPSCHPYFCLMSIPSFPPQHSQAAQTAARYYSVVAWIPLNACQSAQRAESELFKLHLLKDPWCLFLLLVFSNSLKS